MDNTKSVIIKGLQIAAVAIVAVVIIITISVLVFNILLKTNLEKQIAQSGLNIEIIYREQFGQFVQKLKALKPEERKLIRNYIVQYNTLLLNEIDQLNNEEEP